MAGFLWQYSQPMGFQYLDARIGSFVIQEANGLSIEYLSNMASQSACVTEWCDEIGNPITITAAPIRLSKERIGAL